MFKDRPIPNFIARKMYESHSGERLTKEIELLNSGLITPGLCILDIGCGPGHLSVEMAKITGENGEVYALDIHPLAIKSVEDLIKEKGIKNINTVLTRFLDSGLVDNSVDIIFVINTYDMIRNKKKLHHEIQRILKSNGKLVICNKRRLLTSASKFKRIFDAYENMVYDHQDKNTFFYKKVSVKDI